MSYRSSLKSTGSAASKIIFALFLFSLVIFNSCTDDGSFLGRNILPPSDDVYTRFNDQTEINSKVSLGKPILTSVNTTMLLGSMSDSIFGNSKADFMSRFYIYPVTMGTDRVIDSIVLSLKLTKIMGDEDFKPIISVYELTDTLSYDTVYYSDQSPVGFYDPAISLFSGQVNPKDTLISVSLSNDDFFTRLTEAPDSIFSDVLDFGELFKGLYITSEDVSEGGNILYFNLEDAETEINLYYQDDTTGTKIFNMFMNLYSPKVNSYYHDYTNSRATEFLDLPDQQDTLMFISSMGGLDSKIFIENFETWMNVDTLPIAINSAELFIPVTDTLITNEDNDNYPAQLLLLSYDEEDVYDYLHDFRIESSGTYFGGVYNLEKDAYAFNIGMHLQSYINGDVDNLNMILVSTNNATTAERVILNSAHATERKMELKISYTKF